MIVTIIGESEGSPYRNHVMIEPRPPPMSEIIRMNMNLPETVLILLLSKKAPVAMAIIMLRDA